MNYKCISLDTLNVTKVLTFPRYASTSEENRRIPKIYTKTGDKGYLILYYMLICSGSLYIGILKWSTIYIYKKVMLLGTRVACQTESVRFV